MTLFQDTKLPFQHRKASGSHGKQRAVAYRLQTEMKETSKNYILQSETGTVLGVTEQACDRGCKPCTVSEPHLHNGMVTALAASEGPSTVFDFLL